MSIFANSEDNVIATEGADAGFDESAIVDAAPEDTEEVGADTAAEADDIAGDEYAGEDPEGDGMVADEDDECAEADAEELDETMNPAADVVDTSSTGNAEVSAEDEEVADGAVDASAPTPFDPEVEPPAPAAV